MSLQHFHPRVRCQFLLTFYDPRTIVKRLDLTTIFQWSEIILLSYFFYYQSYIVRDTFLHNIHMKCNGHIGLNFSPNVRFGSEDSVEKCFRRHPLDRQHRLASFSIVITTIDVARHAEVGNLRDPLRAFAKNIPEASQCMSTLKCLALNQGYIQSQARNVVSEYGRYFKIFNKNLYRDEGRQFVCLARPLLTISPRPVSSFEL